MQKTPELTASYTNTAKTIERMTTEKHISNFNLFNLQILPVMKTEKLKLD